MNVLEPIIENEKLPELKEEALPPEELNGDELEENEITPFPLFKKIKDKLNIKPFPLKFFNAKNGIIAACLALIAVAGYLNIKYGIAGSRDDGIISPQNEVEEAKESFFAGAVIDRERVRDEALEVLSTITNDENAENSVKESAYEQMERIATETSWEIDIENLIKAKGFEECVAVINGESCDIVVRSDGLTPGEIAQIKEIVYLESGNEIVPKNIKIIEKN